MPFSEYLSEKRKRGEPLTVSEQFKEAVKPRWNIPILSEYTSAIGKMAKKADVGVEKRSEKLKRKGILWEYDAQSMRHGVRKTTKVARGEGGIEGYPKAMDLASFMPFIGDPETGKYSLLDIALAGTEAIPAAKGVKSFFKPEKVYQRKIKRIMKKGGKEKLEAVKQWQTEWITDPETFVRQRGARIKDVDDVRDYTILGDHYKDQRLIKDYDSIDLSSISDDSAEMAYWDWKFGTGEPGGRVAKYNKQTGKKLTSKERAAALDEHPRVKLMKSHGRTAKEIDKFVELAKKPGMTESRMLKEGFADEWDSYLRYKKEMERRFDLLEITEDIPHTPIQFMRGAKRLPEEPLEMAKIRRELGIPDWDQPVQYGFFPEPNAAGVYRHAVDVDAIQGMTWKMDPGAYREMVSMNPSFPRTFESTAVHELQHFITKADDLIPSDVVKAIRLLRRGDKPGKMDVEGLVKFWKEKKLHVLGKDPVLLRAGLQRATDKEIRKTVKYFARKTEIQARLQELRYALGVKPGQKVTQKMLPLKMKHGVSGLWGKETYKELVNVMGKKNVIKALNTLPAIVPMGLEDQLLNQWESEDNPF